MICVIHYVDYKNAKINLSFLYMCFEYHQLSILQKHLGAVALDGLNEEHYHEAAPS